MDPLCASLVDQYLQITNSAVAGEFRGKYRPQETSVVLNEVGKLVLLYSKRKSESWQMTRYKDIYQRKLPTFSRTKSCCNWSWKSPHYIEGSRTSTLKDFGAHLNLKQESSRKNVAIEPFSQPGLSIWTWILQNGTYFQTRNAGWLLASAQIMTICDSFAIWQSKEVNIFGHF